MDLMKGMLEERKVVVLAEGGWTMSESSMLGWRTSEDDGCRVSWYLVAAKGSPQFTCIYWNYKAFQSHKTEAPNRCAIHVAYVPF